MTVIDFVLCPDRDSSRYLRGALVAEASWIGLRVGTWRELLELAASSYCTLPGSDDWRERVEQEARQLDAAFWQASLEADAENTARALAVALRDVIVALGPTRQMPRTPEALSHRGRRQWHDLARLWGAMSWSLPADLAAVRDVLAMRADRAIRNVRVHMSPAMPPLDPWQAALVERLGHDADDPESASGATPRILPSLAGPGLFEPASSEPPHNALEALQQKLFGPDESLIERDGSVQCIGARDALDEVELVASMIQQALADDGSLTTSDIAVLIPDDELYASSFRRVFQRAGLALSGLRWGSVRRDLGREVALHFLLCRRPSPSPVMALASLVSSPLMPWSAARGRRLARTIMEGGVRAARTCIQGDDPDDLLRLFVDSDEDPRDSISLLISLCDRLRVSDETALHVEIARKTAIALEHEIENCDAGWSELVEACRPQAIRIEEEGPLSREGIAVMSESSEPWRRVRRIYAVGVSAGHFPLETGSPSILSERDRAILDEQLGIRFVLGPESRLRRRARLKRQFGAASEAVVCSLPRRDFAGGRLEASSSLSYMARLFAGVQHAEELILDVERTEDRARVVGLPTPVHELVAPRSLEKHDLNLGRNLLGAGVALRSEPGHQSPSRLETLLVSPLAWLLQRIHAEPRHWHVDGLDVLLRGTLAHRVFEGLFAVGEPLPEVEELTHLAATLLDEAIAESAPHLAQPAWRIERRHLARELELAAIAWQRFLERSEAEIIETEITLTGALDGCDLLGRADAILRRSDGRLVVVDYKKSQGKKRIPRMEKGYELQGSLYRRMLESRERVGDEVGPAVAVLYYNLNDQLILGDRDWLRGKEEQGVHVVDGNVASEALLLLKDRFRELRNGRILLNRAGDETRIRKETGIEPYALGNSPLIALFRNAGGEP